jgi:hypothetical protein
MALSWTLACHRRRDNMSKDSRRSMRCRLDGVLLRDSLHEIRSRYSGTWFWQVPVRQASSSHFTTLGPLTCDLPMERSVTLSWARGNPTSRGGEDVRRQSRDRRAGERLATCCHSLSTARRLGDVRDAEAGTGGRVGTSPVPILLAAHGSVNKGSDCIRNAYRLARTLERTSRAC